MALHMQTNGFCFKEIRILAWSALLIFLLTALISYDPKDIIWSHTSSISHTNNLEGVVGAYCADIAISIFGVCAFIFPSLALLRLLQILGYIQWHYPKLASTGIILATISLCSILSLYETFSTSYPAGSGGWVGKYISMLMLSILNPTGTTLILTTILFIAISLTLNHGLVKSITNATTKIKAYSNTQTKKPKPSIKKKNLATPATPIADTTELEVTNKYLKPSTNLLSKKSKTQHDKNHDIKLQKLATELEEKLQAYGVSAKVVAINPGPVITQLELQLASGTKASKITSLGNDLARLLSVPSIRIVEIIPGKTTVGIELPNEARELVVLKEILESSIYQQATSPLTIALGKDIAGNPVITDLGKMPHLLVAGTTGSGKSVGINAMILSLLYKATPEELKLVLIDPKMLELSVYQDIPHLLTPVVTDVQEAAGVLKWCVQEMERRYQLMSLLGVRNIKGYNEKIAQLEAANTPFMHQQGEESKPLESIPYIVVVADEFADMMMVVGKSVEQQIARIAQKARAAGIHLILATQRPSVDVITGLIKANVPSRVAFQVSSKIDSRTIIDQQGADQLLGHGDMLYLPVGANLPIRVHGAFVEDDEVHRVVKALKKSQKSAYQELSKQIENNSAEITDSSNDDPLYKEAIEIVIKSKKASTSHIQRKLRIGYNRAATLIEKMEENGLISPMQGAGKREILIKEIPNE